jgi:hypothetical protein
MVRREEEGVKMRMNGGLLGEWEVFMIYTGLD